MTGTWKGYYRHDIEFMRKETGFDKTGFTIKITAFDGKNFSGSVYEDIATGGMPETGKVTGRVEGKTINLKKMMPVQTLVHPQLGRIRNEHKKHSALYYSGTLNPENDYNGIWKFGIKIGFLFGFLPIPHRPATGTWSMKKID